MTKKEKVARLRALDPAAANELLQTIVVDCIHEGRKMMTSSEILDEICDALRGAGLDEQSQR